MLPSRVPARRQNPALRISATQPESLPGRLGGQFTQAQRRKFDDRQPSGQRFRYPSHQAGRHRTEDQEPAGPVAIGIDGPAQAWKNRGPVLGFVEYDEFFACSEVRPLQVERESVGLLFEVEIPPAESSGQGRFTTLARSNQCHGGVIGQAASDDGGDTAGDHICIIERYF